VSVYAGAHPGAVGDLLPLFQAELELCRLRRGERVLIHSDTHTSPDYPAACLAAVLAADGVPIEVVVPATAPEPEGGPVARLWHDADLVVDMVTATAHAYSSAFNRAVESGTRILRVAEPPDILARLFPDPVVVAAARRGADLLTACRAMHITSPAGTDLRLDLTDRPGVAHVGFVDTPGRWDHWPSAICIAVPQIDRTEGTLVLAPGDALLGWGRLIGAPVRCTLRGGRVERIEGGRDARLLAEALAAYRDQNAYTLSIVGWGCDPRARWERIVDPFREPGGIMDVENAAGNLLLVFGSNTSVNLGGDVRTSAHLNVNCRGHTIAMDGDPAVITGGLVYA
jgi:2,5-dihydroxypyridine 5,6-dioxygenase